MTHINSTNKSIVIGKIKNIDINNKYIKIIINILIILEIILGISTYINNQLFQS